MLAILPTIILAMTLATAVAALSWRQRHPAGPALVELPAVPSRALGTVRTGHIGDADLDAAVAASFRVAPAGSPGHALEVFGQNGAHLADLDIADIVMVRGWSRSRLVLSYGEMRPAYGSAWPAGPAVAGWEIHLVDASGRVVRCLGTPGTSLDAELARLHGLLRAPVAA